MRDIHHYLKDKEESRPLTRYQRLLQYKDRQFAKACADKLKLSLEQFQTNDKLELYFDIYKDEENICYLSKGWGDPGFRLGESIDIDKNIPCFKETFYKILDICSDNLIAIKVFNAEDGKIGLNLQIGLYQDGFNSKVLYEALGTLEDSLQKIRTLLGQ